MGLNLFLVKQCTTASILDGQVTGMTIITVTTPNSQLKISSSSMGAIDSGPSGYCVAILIEKIA